MEILVSFQLPTNPLAYTGNFFAGTEHTDTWVYKNSKHEFCVFASKHALWCKNWAFLRPVNTSLHGDFTLENPSLSMYLLSSQEHTVPLCLKILQFLFWIELSWFWIEGNGRFWDFLTFYVPLCSKKLSVQRVPTLCTFWDLEKTVLHEIRLSGTVLWSPTNVNSPTYMYISRKTW